MRPRGTYGEVSRALLTAAAQFGPAPVARLAEHAKVGYAAASYTASRLVAAGRLQRVNACRPALLRVAEPRAAAVSRLHDQLADLQRLFWGGEAQRTAPADWRLPD
jgi:hypothetical protein